MKFILYTLPTCGVCHMIKTKLEKKNIEYEEHDLTEIADSLNIDHAPVLKVINDNDPGAFFITSPGEMVKMINNYMEWLYEYQYTIR